MWKGLYLSLVFIEVRDPIGEIFPSPPVPMALCHALACSVTMLEIYGKFLFYRDKQQ